MKIVSKHVIPNLPSFESVTKALRVPRLALGIGVCLDLASRVRAASVGGQVSTQRGPREKVRRV